MKHTAHFSHVVLTLLLILLGMAGCTAVPSQVAQVTPIPTLVPTAVPSPTSTPHPPPPTLTPLPTSTPSPIPSATPTSTPTPTPSPTSTATAVPMGASSVLGNSAGGLAITSYQFGNGPDQIIFIGGIHGGYEWNTILLAYRAIDYFLDNPTAIPFNITLTIIPAANPDGLFMISGKEGRFSPSDLPTDTTPGRFNANNVDLNRNWDCSWQPFGLWRANEVSAGEYPFSEPENIILRDFIVNKAPVATVFFHSALNAIFTAGCPETLPGSREIADVYAAAANYPVYEQFTSYPVTGDAGDWLATQHIPSFTVELRNHYDLDWSQNLAGMLALLGYFATE